jgi:arylsulfatase A-like enzyme
MKQLKTIILALLSTTALFSCKTKSDAYSSPNFIIVYADDLGYGDIGCFGAKLISTPHLDKMAEEGLVLTNFHAQPVCGPSRASLMTGCYPQRVGQVNNSRLGVGGGHPLMHRQEITIAEVLKEKGYKTALIGKWHLGLEDKNTPNDQGFDFFYGTPGSNNGGGKIDGFEFAPGVNTNVTKSVFPNVPLFKNQTIVEYPLQQDGITTRYTDETIKFIKQSQAENKPFFIYLAHNMPHIPLYPSKEFLGKSRYGIYGDCVEEIDWNVGRLLQALKDMNLDDNTLVMFTSDNGPWLRPDLLENNECGSAFPLKGGKVTSWEGGFRVPCIIRMPGTISASKISDSFITTMDIFPTFTSIAGARLPDDRIIDGKDISGLLYGKNKEINEERSFYYYINRNLQAVRKGNWKLVLTYPDVPELMNLYWASHFEPVDTLQLYNIKEDKSDLINLAERYPEKVKELLDLAEQARQDLGEGAKVGKGERFWEENPIPGEGDLKHWQKRVKENQRIYYKGMIIGKKGE